MEDEHYLLTKEDMGVTAVTYTEQPACKQYGYQVKLVLTVRCKCIS